MIIQEKYKDHLCVTIPNIGEPDTIKFSDYVPIQPLEAFWKAPRPPSRKKKKPKGHLISELIFGVFNFLKKKNIYKFLPRNLKSGLIVK